MKDHKIIPNTKAASTFYILGSITLVIIGLFSLESLIKPFVIAGLIWFIINQLKVFLEKIRIRNRRIPSVVGGIIAILIIFILVYLIIELIIQNLEGIVVMVPEYMNNLNNVYSDLGTLFKNPKYTKLIQQWIKDIDLSGIATTLLNSFSGMIANLAVILVYIIFLSQKMHHLQK